MFTNWKTTLLGVPGVVVGIVQLAAGAAALFHLTVQGVTITADPGTLIMQGSLALSTGIGLALAKDWNVTGGAVSQAAAAPAQAPAK